MDKSQPQGSKAMKEPSSLVPLAAGLLASLGSALAATHYVDLNSTNATLPYTTWSTAATNIQDAVDAAAAGDEVAVTNGSYATGGRNGSRVAVDKPLNLRSVNGPQFTTIAGGGPCVSLASNASLSGFTLTGGIAYLGLVDSGGGVFCQSSNAVVSNCVITGNQAVAFGGGAYGGTLNNCTLANNSVSYYDFDDGSYRDDTAGGGGAAYCMLNNCTLSGNSASIVNVYHFYGRDFAYGGGAAYCTLNNCALSNNWVAASSYYGYETYQTASGGGTAYCTLSNCTVSGGSFFADLYSSAQCAGAYFCTLDHCTLSSNWGDGSGCALGCALNNCALTDNRDFGANSSTLSNCALAGNSYGGAASCTLKNCALTGSAGYGALDCLLTNCTLAGNFGGGARYSTLNNCIAYFNTGSNYDSSSTLNYCCTTPLPTTGVGNISSDPQLASAFRLSALSPCIGKGNYAAASGTDIDGEPWANPPSIGCDEYHAGAVTGPLSVAIRASFTNVAVGYPVNFTALIDGRTDLSVWEFGDGALEINQPYTAHSWATPGDYPVSLWCFSDSYPGGTNATLTVHVATGLHYVAANSANPVAPYMSWDTAAKNIQDAVDAAPEPGAQVVVTNGRYAPIRAYGYLSMRSLNGAQFTAIDGGHSNRCASLGNDASLSGFTLTNGVSWIGAGALGGALSNCVLIGNSAINNYGDDRAYGGGAYACTLNNCALSGNSAASDGPYGGYGGGAYACTLNNCSLTGNSAASDGPYGGYGGGAYTCTLNNCIAYFNTAQQGANYDSSSTLNYCCATPLPTNGVGNISSDPQLASASHLSAGSPCRGAGSATLATGTDIDGEAWLNPPSIGCDEYRAGAVTGPLNAAISATFNNVQVGFAVGFTAMIEGRTTASTWDFGDGSMATNQPYASHAWTALGDYLVVLRAYNGSQPGGVSASMTIHVVARPTHYVMANSANPSAPYSSWATAATNIQDAVDAATVPGALVLVTNGIYAGGSRVAGGATNRVIVGNLITVQSVNGPLFTIIDGGRSNRCVYLADNTSLSGFTLTNGAASQGGGVQCASAAAVLSNCVVTGNSAGWFGGGAYGGTLNNCTLSHNSAGGGGCGGGAYSSTLNNCVLSGNSARAGSGAYGGTLNNCILTGNSLYDYGSATYGGGAYGGTLNNCTLSGNSAVSYGGGAYGGTLNNCIAYFNSAPVGANYAEPGPMNYCCTTPLPTNGMGNITNVPLFVDTNGWANLRLQSNSPCINAGNSSYVTNATDLDGNPRIKGGTVDIGAYEFQTPTSVISYAWLQLYGLPTDGSADFADPDHDGLNNWQEWRCGTDPTNALSALRLLSPVVTRTNVIVTWQSVAGVTYFLERSTNLGAALTPLATNIPGQPGTTTYTDTNAMGIGARFYRVGVSGQ
jgi:hypothetical protein